MIDEKKIEEAAEKYAKNSGFITKDCYKALFKTGINCFLDNLWHDASEEPNKVDAQILLELCFFGKPQYHVYIFNGFPFYRDIVGNYNVVRYLYIDDLLKGGIHE